MSKIVNTLDDPAKPGFFISRAIKNVILEYWAWLSRIFFKCFPGSGVQSCVLQGSVFSLEPGQDPPLLSETVLVYFCNPPPQLFEHEPIGVQLDH